MVAWGPVRGGGARGCRCCWGWEGAVGVRALRCVLFGTGRRWDVCGLTVCLKVPGCGVAGGVAVLQLCFSAWAAYEVRCWHRVAGQRSSLKAAAVMLLHEETVIVCHTANEACGLRYATMHGTLCMGASNCRWAALSAFATTTEAHRITPFPGRQLNASGQRLNVDGNRNFGSAQGL